MLLANLLLEFSKLVLQGLNQVFSCFLGLFKLLVALNGFFAPVFELLAHAVNIIGDEVD